MVLAIGSYRIPSSANDLTQLGEVAELIRKIRDEADRGHRDLLARIAFLKQQEQHRALAHATQQGATAAGAMFRRPCSCGASDDQRLVHRLDGPCHPVSPEVQPCSTCNGTGCPDCSSTGLAVLNTQQSAPAQIHQFPQAPTAPVSLPTPAN
ncbi:hypothetical protein ACFQX6_11295 [Streptosporangium lutulentum]